VYALFENIQKCKMHEMTFQAGIHGVDLQGAKTQSKPSTNAESVVPLFGDPEDYEELSNEEREDLTKTMLSKHRNWAKGGVLK